MPKITPEIMNTVQMLRHEIAHPGTLLTSNDMRAAVRRLDEAGLFDPVDAAIRALPGQPRTEEPS